MILSVEYLMKIADFFNASSSNPADTGGANKIDDAKQIAAPKSTAIKTAPSTIAQNQTRMNNALEGDNDENDRQMTVNIKIEKPDIILVEHMDNIDTNALILNVNIILLYRAANFIKHFNYFSRVRF